uniref:intraflagellar transport protein 57 homolog n=1 Tax=Solea senegalensis TaxID=28829 RepID=UPI001CD81E72|nr:intraflagellar transport protein 57 homolog [Solea senegalensis]
MSRRRFVSSPSQTLKDDDAELRLNTSKEEIIKKSDDDDDEEEEENWTGLKFWSVNTEAEPSFRPDKVLEATVNADDWYQEVERVLPQLQVSVRKQNKDWRIHMDRMHQYRDKIKSSFKDFRSGLNKLVENIDKTQEKVSSREKYINNQLEQQIHEFHRTHVKLSEVREQFRQVSARVEEKTRVLAEMNDKMGNAKQEMEVKVSSMSDGAPVENIKQSLKKLKQEIVDMDVRIGVIQQTLLQVRVKEKFNRTPDMFSTDIPEPSPTSTDQL